MKGENFRRGKRVENTVKKINCHKSLKIGGKAARGKATNIYTIQNWQFDPNRNWWLNACGTAVDKLPLH